MLCHEGADFSRIVIAMERNFITATSNVYHVHFHVGRKLLFVARTGIFDFFNVIIIWQMKLVTRTMEANI